MIELYSGTPGSGKSYHAVERCYYSLKSGRCNVITNFNLVLPEKFKYRSILECWDNDILSVNNLMAFADRNHVQNRESQTLIVIDEAGMVFNSRDWRDSDRMGWLDFFSQHRKFGFDVILIAQADIMIDKQIRQFVEIENRHRKISASGFQGVLLRPFGNFIDVQFWYMNKVRLRSSFIRYHNKIARCYNTFSTFNYG